MGQWRGEPRTQQQDTRMQIPPVSISFGEERLKLETLRKLLRPHPYLLARVFSTGASEPSHSSNSVAQPTARAGGAFRTSSLGAISRCLSATLTTSAAEPFFSHRPARPIHTQRGNTAESDELPAESCTPSQSAVQTGKTEAFQEHLMSERRNLLAISGEFFDQRDELKHEIQAKTAVPSHQSLKETFEVVRLVPLQEQIS